MNTAETIKTTTWGDCGNERTAHETFHDDMLDAADFEVEDYERRFGDTRPAVRADNDRELQRVIRATDVVVEWDTLGEGYIVYPATRA